MKRALYAIPLATFGLSISGCGDPIVATFAATIFDDTPVPYGDAEYTASASMIVAEDLTVIIAESIDYVDPAAPDYITKFDGTVSVVEKGAKYDISLNVDEQVFVLTCNMDADVNLSCKDINGAAFNFSVVE
jgi:hypothetical protein